MFGLYVWAGVVTLLTSITSFIMFKIITIRTQKGMDVYGHILGFKEYVNTAEKDRLEFQEKENTFFELLPFAMAIGVVDKWSKAFEDIVQNPPEWYQSSHGGVISAHSFTDSVSGINDQTSDSFSSASGGGASGGGGSAGGGAGGGGGGAG
jgi:uncharacterized membrane protein